MPARVSTTVPRGWPGALTAHGPCSSRCRRDECRGPSLRLWPLSYAGVRMPAISGWSARMVGVRLVLLLAWAVAGMLLNPGTATARRVALVVGNGAYRSAPALANPPNDARDVTRSLRGLGFEVTEGIDLDKAGM